jgi:ubiquinone biosynthesis protein
MHPGNIFVARENPQDPKYIAIDCGIIGTLSNEDKHYLAYNLLAFFQRDYQQVAELHIESGWVPHQTRANEFESAIRVVCEPIFEKPLQDISFAQLLLRLFQTARRFNMEVQPQLVLLQKTLLNIEGLGRQLYPELNLWVTARPYLERWLKQQVGVKRLVKEAKTNLPKWLQQLPKMPELTFYSLKQLSRLEMNYQITEQTLEKIERQLRYSRKRSVGLAILGSVFIVVGLSGLLQPQWWQLIAKPEAVVAILGAALLWLGLRPAKKG